MNDKLKYSFDDEFVSKFCYDRETKKIEVYYNAYYDLQKGGSIIERPCTFIIESWKDAKSKIGDDQRLYDLNKHIGIFSMILFMELKGNDLEMLVNTIDNRYITLVFIEPSIKFEEEKVLK